MTIKLSLKTLALGFALATPFVAADASACGGGWYDGGLEMQPEIDHRPAGVTLAEKALDSGRHEAAAGMIVRMMPHIKTLDAKKSDIVARAQRVLAIAAARSSGQLAFGDEVPRSIQDTWLGKTAEHKAENLTWAVATLRKTTTDAEDPGMQTDLAEVLSKVDAHHAEARTILEKLAKKDLVATPQGYAALATLRAAAGDSAGQKLALERCAAMASKGTSCGSVAKS